MADLGPKSPAVAAEGYSSPQKVVSYIKLCEFTVEIYIGNTLPVEWKVVPTWLILFELVTIILYRRSRTHTACFIPALIESLNVKFKAGKSSFDRKQENIRKRKIIYYCFKHNELTVSLWHNLHCNCLGSFTTEMSKNTQVNFLEITQGSN